MKFFEITYRRGKKKQTVVIEADTKILAVEDFYSRELGILLSIKEISKPLSAYIDAFKQRRNNPIANKRANLEKLIAVYDQLSVMLDAGLPLNQVLSEIVKNLDDKMLKAIFTQILNDIEGGKGFYESAKRFKTQLGYISLSMIQLGEETGQLSESLVQLINILRDIQENRMKFKKATRYPIIIVIAMIIAFTIVTIFVIPQFKSFFQEAKMELPIPTKFLLWLEHTITTYGPYALALSIIIGVAIGYAYSRNENVKYKLDKFMLRIYIIGDATMYAMVSRFIYVLMVLVEAGIPLLDALRISSEIVDNSYIKSKIDIIPNGIEEGKSLYQGFHDSELFESMVVEMIRAGEVGGGLGKMLKKVAAIYQKRFNYIVDNIATLIEPILILAIAGFVLTLALGIFLPMWNMVDMAQK